MTNEEQQMAINAYQNRVRPAPNADVAARVRQLTRHSELHRQRDEDQLVPEEMWMLEAQSKAGPSVRELTEALTEEQILSIQYMPAAQPPDDDRGNANSEGGTAPDGEPNRLVTQQARLLTIKEVGTEFSWYKGLYDPQEDPQCAMIANLCASAQTVVSAMTDVEHTAAQKRMLEAATPEALALAKAYSKDFAEQLSGIDLYASSSSSSGQECGY